MSLWRDTIMMKLYHHYVIYVQLVDVCQLFSVINVMVVSDVFIVPRHMYVPINISVTTHNIHFINAGIYNAGMVIIFGIYILAWS